MLPRLIGARSLLTRRFVTVWTKLSIPTTAQTIKTTATTTELSSAVRFLSSHTTIPPYDNWKVADLKEACRIEGMSVGGTKKDLIDRLTDTNLHQHRSQKKLKELCRERNLAVGGSKAVLVQRLVDADAAAVGNDDEDSSSSSSSSDSSTDEKDEENYEPKDEGESEKEASKL